MPKAINSKLLIYRGEHYCDDAKFRGNFNQLYKIDARVLLENQQVNSKCILGNLDNQHMMH